MSDEETEGPGDDATNADWLAHVRRTLTQAAAARLDREAGEAYADMDPELKIQQLEEIALYQEDVQREFHDAHDFVTVKDALVRANEAMEAVGKWAAQAKASTKLADEATATAAGAISQRDEARALAAEKEERLQDALVHRRDAEELRIALAESESRVRELERQLETVIAVAKSAERAPKS